MEEESTAEYKTKIAEKGPKWYGSYEVVERKDDGNGNYLLKSLSGKNKAKSPRNSEYGSDNEDSVPASQDSAIGSQESVPENPSHISSDAMTVLYPNPEEGDTLLSCTLVDDPGCTLPKMTAHIPVHIPSCGDDEVAFLPDLVETEPTTPVPVHTEGTLSAAEILLDLAGGQVVSDQDESAQSLECRGSRCGQHTGSRHGEYPV